MKNAVMTICMNYSYDIFHRFISSLFDSTTNIELIIFISKTDEVHLKKLIEIYPDIKYFIVDNENIHIVNYRFYLYYTFLIKHINIYNLIFICDSRDVLFQKDIFTHPIINNKYDLYIFEEETNNITIDKCRFNSLYVKKSGLEIENIVHNKPILCVGTILGTQKGIVNYLQEFNNILFNDVNDTNKSYYGTDSGINYKIIYSNLLKNINICICKNNDLLVYTMAFPIFLNKIDYNILLNSNQQICYNNKVCYCVHQYDRLDNNIKKKMSIKYNYLL